MHLAVEKWINGNIYDNAGSKFAFIKSVFVVDAVAMQS